MWSTGPLADALKATKTKILYKSNDQLSKNQLMSALFLKMCPMNLKSAESVLIRLKHLKTHSFLHASALAV